MTLAAARSPFKAESRKQKAENYSKYEPLEGE